ncbi:MAG: hypothetical protein WEF86_01995 [Gemmatimonadota bacterium]
MATNPTRRRGFRRPLMRATATALQCLLPAVMLLLTAGVPLRGQSAEWNATLLVQPYPSPFFGDWERNPQTALLTVLYSGVEPREYRVEAILRSRERGDFGRALSPLQSFPFGPSSQLLTAADLPEWRILSVESDAADVALRSGLLPQGNYEICTYIRDVQGDLLAEACAEFTITLPEPPQLILPADGAVLQSSQPVFQWTPVLVPPQLGLTYRLRIVERRTGQTPVVALESNLPHLEAEVVAVPMSVYPLDALPLEEGRDYVWRIETLDGAGQPITAGQRHSEVWSFTYSGPSVLSKLGEPLPEPFELVPGVASVAGTRMLSVRETEHSYVLNGSATLQLSGPFEAMVAVEVEDLEIDRGALPEARILGGRLSGRLSADALPEGVSGRHVRFDELEFTPTGGLRLAGSAALPGVEGVRLAGTVAVTAGGLVGVLAADGGGTGLFVTGADPVALRVRQVQASWPGARLEMRGSLEVFGRDIGCGRVTAYTDSDGGMTALVSCQPAAAIPLVEGVERVQLRVRALTGSLVLGETSSGLAHSLTAAGELELASGAARCGAAFELGLEDGALEPRTFRPLCDPTDATLDLGSLRLRLSALELERLTYTAGAGFDFAARMDADVSARGMPQLALPQLTGVVLTPRGVTFPETDAAIDHPRADIGGFGVRVTRARMAEWTMPWRVWDAGADQDADGAGLRFGLDMDVTLRGAGAGAPACLTSDPIRVAQAELAEGRLTAELAERVFEPACALPLGGGGSFELHRLAGVLAVRFSPDAAVERTPDVHGAFVLPPIFQCADDAERRLTLEEPFSFTAQGRLIGSASTGAACPVHLAGVTMTLKDARLELGEGDGQQTAALAAGADARFTAAEQPVSGSGAIVLDLLAGRLRSGRIDFAGPFRFELPRAEPVLSFRIGAAHLDSVGLHVNGQQELRLPGDEQVPATFDDVTFGLDALSITGGRVSFGAPFALEVTLPEDGRLTWRAVAPSASFDAAAGMRFDLPPEVVLDASGFTVQGEGTAQLAWQERRFEGLTLRASDDFGMSLDPFAVRSGVARLEREGIGLAHVDALGFHPNPAYFVVALLPARLGLPGEDVAYIELRDGAGELRVDAEPTAEGVRISTRPGETVPLVIPALQHGASDAPRLDVTFALTLDAGSRATEGSMGVAVPADQRASFDLSAAGIPFAIDSIAYDAADPTRLQLAGHLVLFDAAHGDAAAVRLALDGNGALTGTVDIVPVQDPLPVRSGTTSLMLALRRITGTFDSRPADGVLRYDLDADAAIVLDAGSSRSYGAALRLALTERGMTVSGIVADETAATQSLDIGVARLQLSNLRVPLLAWSHDTRAWDFELLFDAALEFPSLESLALPVLRDIALRPDGMSLPAFEAPQLMADPVPLAGFTVRPLAFRMPAVHLDWFGAPPPELRFGFDLELGFAGDAAPALRETKLSILDAVYADGRFTGAIEPRSLAEPLVLPLGDGGMALHVMQLGGQLGVSDGDQRVAVTAGGSFLVPPAMRCGGEENSLLEIPPEAVITLVSDGRATGTVAGLAPACPLNLGPLSLNIRSAELIFAVGGDAQHVELDLDGALRLPGPVAGDTIEAAGALGVDLVNVQIVRGSIAIESPFRWNVPAAEPLLRFVVQRGSVDAAGVHLTGTGGLDLLEQGSDTIGGVGEVDAIGGANVAVAFNDLVVSLTDFQVTGGSATIQHSFGLEVGLERENRPRYRAKPRDQPRSEDDGPGFTVVLPENMTFDAGGLRIGGSGTAELAYGDTTYGPLRIDFTNGFAIAHEPAVAVSAGRAGFILNDREIAYLDATGFWPGDLFGMLPLPTRLGLPAEQIAYLELRDATGAVLVESAAGADGLTLRTRAGQPLPLRIPALDRGAGMPTVLVEFEMTVNPTTHQPVAGFVRVAAPADAPALFSLTDLGLPLEVRNLAYEQVAGEYVLRLAARLPLPPSLGGLVLDFDDLRIAEDGIRGTAHVGSYSEAWDAGATAILSQEIARDVSLDLYGARATFGDGASELKVAGALRAGIFADPSLGPALFFFTGAHGADGFAFTADVHNTPEAGLAIGLATFEPVAIGEHAPIEVTATADELSVRLGGVLRLPTLSETFALTIDGLAVGTNGIVFPQVALSTGGAEQAVQLFGIALTLRDSIVGGGVVSPGVAFAYGDDVLRLTLAGELEFLGSTTRFQGLRVGTDGSIALESASLLSQPLVLATDLLVVDALAIENSRLRADLAVTLPAPFATDGPQRAHFTIAPDGTIEGGAAMALLSEVRGLGSADGEDRTQLPFGIATVHPYHVGLALDFADIEQSAVEVVADLYVANVAENRIAVGSVAGGVVAPGLRIGFDGSRTWGHFALEREFDFDFDAVRLLVTSISVPDDGAGFAVEFGGRLSLDLAAVSGGLAFTGFRIDDGGSVRLDPDGIEGGEFSIAGVVNIEVNGFSYSDAPATIQVAGGGMPTGDQPATSATESVQVESYIRFGGRIDVADVFAGGVDEFLLFRTAEGESQMLVRGASLDVYDVVSMTADFRYREAADGFEMLLGGTGKLMQQYDVSLVGAIGNSGGVNRVGVFVAAGVQIPIPPAIMVTQLGGGFFYNPKPEYLSLVRQYADVGTAAGEKIRAQTGRFAVLLYGGASIIDRSLIEGRVLLTVMPTALQIDGAMQVLSQGSRFHGDAHLVVGLQKAYAEGNIAFNVDYNPILGGAGAMEFFVYGPDAWGIMGSTDVRYMLTLTGGSQLFIGPPGFLVTSEISQDFDIWILRVRGGLDASAWYRRAANEWGAYTKIGVSASVLGGAATARGDLHGALILAGTPVIYAAGRLRGCAAGQCKRFSAWASFRNGDIRGGEGSNSAMADAIEQAQAVAGEMADAQAEAEGAIADAQVQADLIVMSDEELAAAYDVMQRWGTTSFAAARSHALAMEDGYAPDPADAAYLDWYMSLLLQQGAPRVDEALVRQYSDSVTVLLDDIGAQRTAVLAALDDIQLQVAGLEQMVEPPDFETPVMQASFAPPVTRTVMDENGMEAKVLDSGPGFEVDGPAAARATEGLAGLQTANETAGERTRELISALETGLATLRTATLAGGSGSLLDYNSRLAAAHGAAVRPFAVEADMILRRQDWMRSALAALGPPQRTLTRTGPGPAFGAQTRYDAIHSIISRKTVALQNEPSRIYNLARARLRLLDAWAAGSPTPASSLLAMVGTISLQETNATLSSVLTSSVADLPANVGMLAGMMAAGQPMAQQFANVADGYEADTAQYRAYVSEQANAAGLLVWYYLAHAGMTAADERADAALPALLAAYDQRVPPLEQAHGDISASSNRLFAAQAALTGVLHDIYDIELASTADETVAAPLRARRDSLRTELSVPHVDNVLITSTTSGYYSTQTLQWAGSHPRGAYEYLFSDVAAGDPEGAFRSAGRTGSLTRYQFARARTEPPVSRSVYAGVRGGAGFIGAGRTDYTLAYSPGASAVTATTTGGAVGDATPPTVPVVAFNNVPVTVADGDEVAWTLSDNEFEPRWSAYDGESGIASYEYAAGTTPGGTDLRDWTPAGGRTTVRAQGMAISSVTPLYVSVRARNGADLLSAVGTSPPLRRDATPPTFAADAAAAILDAPAGVGGDAPAWAWRACPIPLPVAAGTAADVQWGSQTPGAVPGAVAAVPARRSFELPHAVDAESGIDRYLWRIADAPQTELADAGWTEQAGHLLHFDAEGAPLDYTGTFYITMFARNRAGLTGTPVVLGPFDVPDPTAPQISTFCAGAARGQLQLHVTRAGADAETGITRYEYRVFDGDSPVQDWTALDGTAAARVTLAGFQPVPGSEYHVELRGVNGQGQHGRAARSGPVYTDDTPPPAPAVSATANASRLLSIAVDAPTDPESGLFEQQQMAIRPAGRNTDFLVDWRTVPGAQPGAYATSLQLPSTAGTGVTYTLMLRTINRAGLATIAYRDFTIPAPAPTPVRTRSVGW